MHQPRQLETLHTRSKITIGLLIALGAGMLALTMGDLFTHTLIGSSGEASFEFAAPLSVFLLFGAIGYFLLFLVTIIAWCMWLHRAYKNLSELFYYAPEITPGWAVGYHFIPFINLFKPLQTMREIWTACAPPSRSHDHKLVNTWWAFWLGSNVASNAINRLSIDGVNDFGLYMLVSMGDLALFGASTYFAIKVVHAITQLQLEFSDNGEVADVFS